MITNLSLDFWCHSGESWNPEVLDHIEKLDSDFRRNDNLF